MNYCSLSRVEVHQTQRFFAQGLTCKQRFYRSVKKNPEKIHTNYILTKEYKTFQQTLKTSEKAV